MTINERGSSFRLSKLASSALEKLTRLLQPVRRSTRKNRFDVSKSVIHPYLSFTSSKIYYRTKLDSDVLTSNASGIYIFFVPVLDRKTRNTRELIFESVSNTCQLFMRGCFLPCLQPAMQT